MAPKLLLFQSPPLLLLLLLLGGTSSLAEPEDETQSSIRTLQLETLVEPPEACREPAAFGDTLHIHYTGSLEDGRIVDTSLTRDPLVIELGQKQVIPGIPNLEFLPKDRAQISSSRVLQVGIWHWPSRGSETTAGSWSSCFRGIAFGIWLLGLLVLDDFICCLEQSLLDMCVGEKRRAIIPPHLAYGKRGFPPSIPGDAVLQFEVELIALVRANYWQKLVKTLFPLLGICLVPALLGLIGYYLYSKANSPKISKKKLREEKKNKSKKK